MASEMPKPETIQSPTADSFAPAHSRTASAASVAEMDESSTADAVAANSAPSTPSGKQAIAGFSLAPLPSPPGTFHQRCQSKQHRHQTQQAAATQPLRQPHPQPQRPQRHHQHAPHPRPSLTPILTRLRFPLAPLHPLPTGSPHPYFPAALLNYHLLTEPQLDALARYYHQLTSPGTQPCIWTFGYPTAMEHYDAEFLQYLGEQKGGEARLRAKRRMWGRFIGLRGCEVQVGGEEERARERWLRRVHEVTSKNWGERAWGGRF